MYAFQLAFAGPPAGCIRSTRVFCINGEAGGVSLVTAHSSPARDAT